MIGVYIIAFFAFLASLRGNTFDCLLKHIKHKLKLTTLFILLSNTGFVQNNFQRAETGEGRLQ